MIAVPPSASPESRPGLTTARKLIAGANIRRAYDARVAPVRPLDVWRFRLELATTHLERLGVITGFDIVWRDRGAEVVAVDTPCSQRLRQLGYCSPKGALEEVDVFNGEERFLRRLASDTTS